MKVTRKNFLRWGSAVTAGVAIESTLSACGGNGGGSESSTDAGGGSAPSSVSQSGGWSNPATWGGTVPTAADDVTIGAGQTIILDTTAAVCKSLNIVGRLQADTTKNIGLTAGNVNVAASGVWTIGIEASPFPAAFTCTITLNGAEVGRTARTVSGTNLGFTNNGVGRSIQVQPGGTLNFIGSAPAITRTKLNANAANGANTFTLADATNWKVGDEVAIGTTDFFGVATSQKLTLSANASGASISTTSGITGARWGAMQYVTDSGMSLTPGTLSAPPSGAPTTLDQRAFVVNLTRNIVVQGANDAAWTANKFGAHMMFMGRTSNIKLNGVQLRRVGQAGANGRYPIHWHMMSYNMPGGMSAVSDGTFLGAVIGNYAKNCVVEQSSQRMVVIHGTHGVTLDSNVGFDITGHAIFLEDGSEQNNTITNNVVMKVRAPSSANLLLLHDIAPSVDLALPDTTTAGGSSGIWFTNPVNTLTGNWVCDCEGTGIWNSFPPQPFGLSANVALVPRELSFKSWSDNTAMGNMGVGVLTGFNVMDDRGQLEDGTYRGGSLTDPVVGIKTFKNRGGGYYNRVLLVKYQAFVGADNAAMDVFGASQNQDSVGVNFLTIAESLNNTNSRRLSSKRSAFATYHEFLNFRDSIAVGYQYISGTQYSAPQIEIGGGLYRLQDLYTDPLFTFQANTGIKQINCTAPFRAKSPNIDGHPLSAGPSMPGLFRHWALATAIRDVNGLFVPAGKHWVYNDPFLTYGATSPTNVYAGSDPVGSNGVYTDDRYFGIGGIGQDGYPSGGAEYPLTVTRQDNAGATVGSWVIGDGATSWVLNGMRHWSAHNGGRYIMELPGHMATNYVFFTVWGMTDVNDTFLLGVRFSGSSPAKVYQRGNGNIPFSNSPSPGKFLDPGATPKSRALTATGSMANVVADTIGTIYWQDTVNNVVWFKVNVTSLALATDFGTDGRGNVLRPVGITVSI